jgi:hypothetical protein
VNRFLLALLCLATLASACSQAPARLRPTGGASPSIESTSPRGEPPQFTIALEYAIPGLAKAYAPTHVTYVKPQPIFGLWRLLEPEPGVYNWSPLDNLVVEYQEAGFSGIQLLITAESSWASIDPPSLTNPGNTFPKDEYVDDYVDFVRRFVERYDGDGTEDAPGLLYPVHHYGIEREFTGYWPSDAQDYVRLLGLAYPAVHAADPQAEVLLVAILMVDVFDGDPDPVELQRRLATPQLGIRKSVPEIQAILSACDSYDIIDFHSLGDYTEIPTTTAWLRNQLENNGCDEKPIWVGDAFSMSALVGYNGRPAWPATPDNLDRVLETLKLVANPNASGHLEAKSWLYALMASNMVKKITVSAGEGLIGVNIGNLEDWKTNIPALDAAAVRLAGTSMFMGMMDTTVTQKRAGEGLPNYRAPGQPRPAFYAIKLANEKIASFASVEKLELWSGVWAYHFSRPSGPLWVLWYDDGTLYFPGETPATVSVDLPFAGANALITRTPVASGMEIPETESPASSNGTLSLVLDSTPIFIEVGPE